MVSYNVAGIANKLLFPSFFNFLKNYDIFLLHETFVTQDSFCKYVKYFGNFNLHWISATKEARFGRAKGGSLYGINLRSPISMKFNHDYSRTLIEVNVNANKVYVLPTYLNYNEWDRDFNDLSQMLESMRDKSIMVIGDLNVRIGELQPLPDEINSEITGLKDSRCSKDKVVNSRGKRFLELAADYGLLILNGRTNGDYEGEYTCIQAAGASVNDISAVSIDMIPNIGSFMVEQQPFSDHMPISVHLSASARLNNTKDLELLPKLSWNMQQKEEYERKLEQISLRLHIEERGMPSLEKLIKAIKDSAYKAPNGNCKIYRQKWFDGECLRSRKQSFKWLNLFRKTSSEYCRKMYVQSNKEYKKLLTAKKNTYFSNIGFKLSNVRESREWWSLAKEFCGRKFVCGKNISTDDFSEYFQGLLNPNIECNTFIYAEPDLTVPDLDEVISMEEVLLVLRKAKDNKAPGNDGIPYEFLKYAPMTFLNLLLDVYNKFFSEGEVPGHFVESLIFPIFKKGDPNDVHNYGGLSFNNVVAKIFVNILTNRLAKWEQRYCILNENQAGFRSGYSAVDNVFNMVNLIHISWKIGKKKIYSFFVDFRAAFDTINRDALYYKLFNLGVSNRMMRILKSLYSNTRASVWNGQKSEQFETSSGLKQGCPGSPLLFAFFINDLEESIGGGVNIEGIHIRVLLYADDLILLADNPGTLKAMITNLEGYCKLWSLQVNLEKSKIMIFNRGGGVRTRHENWYYEANQIEVVNKYKYLGVTLTPKLSFKKHLEERLSIAKCSINTTWRNFISKKTIAPSAKYQVFNAVSKAIMCYGTQVWGFRYYEEVEKLQRFFLKRLLGLPQHTPNYMLHLETGLIDIYIYTLKCHMKYIHKALNVMPEYRYPRLLASKIITKRIYWYEEWEYLMNRHQLDISPQSIGSVIDELIDREKLFVWNQKIDKARQSIRHDIYSKIEYSLGEESYFSDNYSVEMIRYIFKCRGGLLQLNSCPFRTSGGSECSMCSKQEDENTYHFLGVCPILSEYRRLYFGSSVLTFEQTLDILNGKNWRALFGYAKDALRYRRFLVNEYNT